MSRNPFYGYQSNRDVERLIGVYGIDRLAAGFQKPRVLDIGCNEGAYCKALAPQASQCVGIEPAKEIIGPAMRRPPENCIFVNRPFNTGRIRGERFDMILLMAVISHLQAPALLGRCIASALNPGGCLVFLTHTLGCDTAVEYKTDRLDLEFRRFLNVEDDRIISCEETESNDKQGREKLHRRLIVYRNSQSIQYNGSQWRFHAAGGTSKVYLSEDKTRIFKWFDTEVERKQLHELMFKLVDVEAKQLQAFFGQGVYPTLLAKGKRFHVQEYCGEQPNIARLPQNWEEQIFVIQEKLVEANAFVGDVAPENMLISNEGKIRLIDPVFIEGQHQKKLTNPSDLLKNYRKYMEKDVFRQPDLRVYEKGAL